VIMGAPEWTAADMAAKLAIIETLSSDEEISYYEQVAKARGMFPEEVAALIAQAVKIRKQRMGR